MRVAVAGASGFVGRHLCPALIAAGHEVLGLVRVQPGRDMEALAGALGGAQVRAYDPLDAASAREALEGCTAVVNLAGESILGGRWTAAFLAAARASRIDTTTALVEAMGAMDVPPTVLVSASAIGVYGACEPNDVRTEYVAELGHDLLAELCRAWEAAALGAEAQRTRVVLLRVGLVLGQGGGALQQMEKPFRMGVGGRIASGAQVMSWIHIGDLVRLIGFCIENPDVRGPVNATGPAPVSNAEFTRSFARRLGRPALLPVPAFVLRLLFGRGAALLTSGQRVHPRAALDAGFRFEHPDLDEALADLYPDA